MQDESESARSEAQIATELVQRIAAGDTEAENQLVERYSRGLLLMLTARTHDAVLAADLRQDTLIVAIEKLRNDGLGEPHKLAGYLSGIARNLVIAHRRKQARQKTSSDTDLIDRCADQRQGHYEHIEAEENAALVHRLLAELRVDRDREILTRVYVYDQDKDSICSELSLDSLHYNRVLYRARQRLRELLEAHVATEAGS